MYIADQNNDVIRKVTLSGTYGPSGLPTTIPSKLPSIQPTHYPSLSPHSISIITTIAGTGTAGYSGDGGQATSATLYCPTGIDIDASGNVYFTDHCNHCVRKITASTGIISTYAGTGVAAYSGDGGLASSATLYSPEGLCFDASGSNQYLYIADQYNHCVRKITTSTSIISTIAGTGTIGYSGDNGPATSATFNVASGVAVDTSGNNKN